MSIDNNKDIARHYYVGVWGKADPAVFEQIVYPDITVIYSSLPGRVHGRDALQQLATRILASFPDLELFVDEVIAEAENVVGRWTASGTHRGQFRTFAPTGRAVRWTGLSICRIADGKLIEEGGEEDISGTANDDCRDRSSSPSIHFSRRARLFRWLLGHPGIQWGSSMSSVRTPRWQRPRTPDRKRCSLAALNFSMRRPRRSRSSSACRTG